MQIRKIQTKTVKLCFPSQLCNKSQKQTFWQETLRCVVVILLFNIQFSSWQGKESLYMEKEERKNPSTLSNKLNYWHPQPAGSIR